MKEFIKADLYRYNKQTSVLKGMLFPGFVYMYFFRKASNKRNKIMGGVNRFIIRVLRYRYGFQIPVGTCIGKGFYIGHFGTVVINKGAKIGENCNIAHNVTIGQTNRGRLQGCPTIGNKVWIGTGSVIVGKITIGDNVLIAPNSYVNRDIPANSLVIGNPSKIISKENPTEGYVNNIYLED